MAAAGHSHTGIPTVQPAVVFDDAVDDVRERAERRRPKEAEDERHHDAGDRHDRDERPRAKWRQGVADPLERDVVDQAERLVEEPHADGRRRPDDGRPHPECDIRPGARPVGRAWVGGRRHAGPETSGTRGP